MPRNTSALPSRATILRAQLPSVGNGHPPDLDSDSDRLARIETLLADIQRRLDVQFQRTADLQVQLDRAIASDRPKPNR